MRYRLHLNPEPSGQIDASGTNYIRSLEEFADGKNVIDWEILDTLVGRSFIKSFNLVSSYNFGDKWLAWNRYGKHSSWTTVSSDMEKLNAEVALCIKNNWVPGFTSDDFVNLDQNTQERVSRLNKIHFEFESELIKIRESGEDGDPDLLKCLERLNRLVHSLEKLPGSKEADSYYVVRWSSLPARDYFDHLTDDMYSEFNESVLNGDIYSDFFTVGKDLGHAFYSKDISLVQNKEVKQQTLVSGAVAFGFSDNTFGRTKQSDTPLYHDWCETHRVQDFGYEYTKPKYNLGRAPVGRLNGYSLEDVTKILEETPYITKVEII